MLLPVLIGLVLGGVVGWLAGWLLHRRVDVVLDTLQGVCGAAICMEVYALTGPLKTDDLLLIALLGAWVSLGVAHATADLIRGRHSNTRRTPR
jgi:uncharacterized membrane protein YeaQ/YmgE (transglycosylase-associated protein family)